MSKTKNQVIDQQNDKQQTIQYLTDLMATICGYYYKGRLHDAGISIHEGSTGGTISIDLYNFEGDGNPVCEGLKPCTVTYDDGSTDTGHFFCMCYDPDDDITPLVFLFSHDEYGDGGDIELDPDDVPLQVLHNITAWLEQQWRKPAEADAVQCTVAVPQSAAVQQAKDIIALWSDWCMGYDDEDLWLDYMVKHPKAHCNRQHLQKKWDCCYGKYGSKAAMQMFWRELDNDNRAILTEYITTEWHKD